MKAQEAREFAFKVKSEDEAYSEIISKIKILAENGHHRLITNFAGVNIIGRLSSDGYWVFDGAPSGSQQMIISW